MWCPGWPCRWSRLKTGASACSTKYRLPSGEPRGREVPGTLDPRDVLLHSHITSELLPWWPGELPKVGVAARRAG